MIAGMLLLLCAEPASGRPSERHAAVTVEGLTFDCAFHRVTDERNGDEQRNDFLRRSEEEQKSTKAQIHRSREFCSVCLFVDKRIQINRVRWTK